MTEGALSDVSVLELTTMIAGPYAGQMLGDLGADVVKIERPEQGELARSLEPTVGGESFYYLTANRNKRSLTLDVTKERGREVFLDLVEDVDVVLENFSSEFTEKYGIGYDTVKEQNESVIYCSISAFGETGPYQNDPGIDTTVQALTGAMSMSRNDTTKPMRSGVPMNDVFGALYAVQGILTTLYSRGDDEDGEFIDVSLLDAGVAGLTTRATYSLMTGERYPPFGRRHNYFAPEGTYEVADGEVQLSVVTDRHWERFCQVVEVDELSFDERFESVNGRVENRDELNATVEQALSEWTEEELVASLRENDIPAATVNDTLSVWEDAQVKARNMRQSIDHPRAGTIDTLGHPVKYDGIETDIELPPPVLGAHSKEVLEEHEYTEEEIRALAERGIIDRGK